MPRTLRELRRHKLFSPIFFPYYYLKVALEIRKTPKKRDSFLDTAKGVIHIGAHRGQEIRDYAKRKLRVLWIEANPETFPHLQANLRGHSKQKCLLGLIGSKNNKQKGFYISSNDGASSSIFPLDESSTIWPNLKISKKILLDEQTLPSLLQKAELSILNYDTLILDVQGAELQILKGISSIETTFRGIQIEACNFSLYKGAPTFEEVDKYLQDRGYSLISQNIFAQDPNGRKCFDCRYFIQNQKF